MARPICVEHACEMRPDKNGVRVVEYVHGDLYQLRWGDRYKCPIGGEMVVSGFGEAMQGYEVTDLQSHPNDLVVNHG